MVNQSSSREKAAINRKAAQDLSPGSQLGRQAADVHAAIYLSVAAAAQATFIVSSHYRTISNRIARSPMPTTRQWQQYQRSLRSVLSACIEAAAMIFITTRLCQRLRLNRVVNCAILSGRPLAARCHDALAERQWAVSALVDAECRRRDSGNCRAGRKG